MAIGKQIFIIAFVITFFIFSTFLFVNAVMDDKRENQVETGMQEVTNKVIEIQTLLLLGEVYGEKMTCLIFREKLQQLDSSLWELGLKIDQYRRATESFQESPYYKQQKKIFNEQEVLYLSLLKKGRERCEFTTPIILFFYQNSDDCDKCDDQSYILADINRKADAEVSIFSFDLDLNLTTVRLLDEYYAIPEYPCVVVEETKMCAIQDYSTIVKTICDVTNISLCNLT